MSGWTEAEDAVLRAEWKQGITAPQIASTLNARFGTKRTRCSVLGRKHRLGLPGRETTVRVVRVRNRIKRKSPARPAESVPIPVRTSPVPVQPVVPPRPAEPMRRVEITELVRNECRWPVNDPAGGEVHLFCGRKQADGSSYCAAHLERSISKQSESARKVQPVSRKVAYS